MMRSWRRKYLRGLRSIELFTA